MRKAVLDALSVIDYVPFTAACLGNPAYDLGDVLSFTGGIADGTKKYCITRYSWSYGRSYKMEGVGKNPTLASARSKSDKNLTGLLSTIATKDFVFYAYTNMQDLEAEDAEVMIISIQFTSNADTYGQFLAQVLFDITCHEEKKTRKITLTKEAQADSSSETPVSYVLESSEKTRTTATFSYRLNGEVIKDYAPE